MTRVRMRTYFGLSSGQTVAFDDFMAAHMIDRGLAEPATGDPQDGLDPLLAAILAMSAKLRNDTQSGPTRPTTPLGWATWLAETAERMAVFVGSTESEDQAANLAEIRGTAIRASALAMIVARMADEGRPA